MTEHLAEVMKAARVLQADLSAAQDEIEKLKGERDRARDLAVRSGVFQDIQERADQATGCPTSETDVPRLVAALRAVLDLHPREMGSRYCAECETRFHPCPTIRAITEALSGEQ